MVQIQHSLVLPSILAPRQEQSAVSGIGWWQEIGRVIIKYLPSWTPSWVEYCVRLIFDIWEKPFSIHTLPQAVKLNIRGFLDPLSFSRLSQVNKQLHSIDESLSWAKPFPLQQLPEDIQVCIEGCLDTQSLTRLSQVNKKFYVRMDPRSLLMRDERLLHNNDQVINKMFCEKHREIIHLLNSSEGDSDVHFQMKWRRIGSTIGRLDLSNFQYTDRQLERIVTYFPNLHSLNMKNCPCSDIGLQFVVRLTQLRNLFLERSGSTDFDWQSIRTLLHLERLDRLWLNRGNGPSSLLTHYGNPAIVWD